MLTNHIFYLLTFEVGNQLVVDAYPVSAGVHFANYILSQKLWNGEPIAIEQGGNNRIFNAVKLKYQNGKVLFGGKATKKIEGVYLV